MKINITRYLDYGYFALQLLTSAGFIIRDQYTHLFNPLLTSGFYLGVLLLERFTVFDLGNGIRILLILTLSGHTIIGEYFYAYKTTSFFDDALHMFGTFSFALFAYCLLITFIKLQASSPAVFTFILVLLLGISLGTIFELMEFFLDYFFNQLNQNGLKDTDLDLLFDLIGAIFAGILIVKKRLFSQC